MESPAVDDVSKYRSICVGIELCWRSKHSAHYAFDILWLLHEMPVRLRVDRGTIRRGELIPFGTE